MRTTRLNGWLLSKYDRVGAMNTIREIEKSVYEETGRRYKGPATLTLEICHQSLLFKRENRHTSQRH